MRFFLIAKRLNLPIRSVILFILMIMLLEEIWFIRVFGDSQKSIPMTSITSTQLYETIISIWIWCVIGPIYKHEM